MTKPTRSQWRGYLLLCLLLTVTLVLVIVIPRKERPTPVNDHSELKEMVNRYGDSLLMESDIRRQRYYNAYSKRDTFYNKAAYHRDFAYDKGFASHSVEINSADSAELCKLYGIGPAFASRIMKYRNLLGGFVRKEQLLEVYGMTEERYLQFADNVVVDTSLVEKININTATLATLKRHPYLDYYQAKAIVSFREQGNRFNNYADLLVVNLVDEVLVSKLKGYIQF